MGFYTAFKVTLAITVRCVRCSKILKKGTEIHIPYLDSPPLCEDCFLWLLAESDKYYEAKDKKMERNKDAKI